MAIKEINLSELKLSEAYRLMTSAIVPRPIAWVSSCDEKGIGNLAPFSYFNAVATKPPTVMFSIVTPQTGSKKDTEKNLIQVPEFVVNMVSESLLDQMIDSAAAYPYGIDETEVVGLTPVRSTLVRPARVAESSISFECKVSKTVVIGEEGPGSCKVIFGEILLMHVDDSLLAEDGRIDVVKFKPVARLGGDQSVKLGEIVSRGIPRV